MEAQTTQSTKAKKPTTKNILTEVKKYKVDTAMSLPRRIADFLAWCARECPNQYIPFNILATIVTLAPRTLNPQSAEIEKVRRRWAPVRKMLLEEYRRDLDIQRGFGARATNGSEDVAKTTLVKKINRYKSSRASIESTLRIVNSSEIQDKKTKTWIQGLSPAFKALSSPDLINKLLPPEEEKKK